MDTLKAAGVTPIALGAIDGWPAEHWWMAFLVQRCGVETVYQAIEQNGASFTDECFVQACRRSAGPGPGRVPLAWRHQRRLRHLAGALPLRAGGVLPDRELVRLRLGAEPADVRRRHHAVPSL